MKKTVAILLCCVLLLTGFSVSAAPSVSSVSAVIYVPETGEILWQKDGNTPRPMASTTKLMTALLGAQLLELDREITMPKEAVLVEGSSLGLKGGDRITVRDLLTGMLLESGNDAANVVALTVDDSLEAFARRMNEKAAALGMTDSGFVTPSGLDAVGHQASAADMAKLAAAVLEDPFLAEVCATKQTQISFGSPPVKHTVTNHNKLLTKMSDCIGLKTGFTTKAGRCLVSAAKRDGITLIVVTLNGHDYWNDHQALYDYGFSQVKRATLPAVAVPPLPIAGGVQDRVGLVCDPLCPPIVSADDTSTFVAHTELPAFVLAPVEKGEIIGRVCFETDTGLCYTTPLRAAEAVKERPVSSVWIWWWRFFCALLAAWG